VCANEKAAQEKNTWERVKNQREEKVGASKIAREGKDKWVN